MMEISIKRIESKNLFSTEFDNQSNVIIFIEFASYFNAIFLRCFRYLLTVTLNRNRFDAHDVYMQMELRVPGRGRTREESEKLRGRKSTRLRTQLVTVPRAKHNKDSQLFITNAEKNM